MYRLHTSKSLLLTVLSVFVFLLSACSDDQSAGTQPAVTETPAGSATGQSTAAEMDTPAGDSSSTTHPVLEGIERAEGVVYMDEIYK
jgi:hypothetical protein